MFMDEETKSRFTEYSLTSSVMRRNEQLTLLDDRFEKVRDTALGQRTRGLGEQEAEKEQRRSRSRREAEAEKK